MHTTIKFGPLTLAVVDDSSAIPNWRAVYSNHRRVGHRLASFLLWPFVAMTIAVNCLAQTSGDREFIADVRTKLEREARSLQAKSYHMEGAEFITAIAAGSANRVPLQLAAGTTYAIVAACDKDCGHVQISLFDQAGVRLIQSPEKEPVVIIGGAPPSAGAYAVELQVPGCRTKTCHAGIFLMRLEDTTATSNEEETRKRAFDREAIAKLLNKRRDPTPPLTVNVDSAGKIFLQSNEIDIAQLESKLRDMVNEHDGTIFLRGDRGVDYGTIMRVMAAMKRAGFDRASLVTDATTPSPSINGGSWSEIRLVAQTIRSCVQARW